MTKFIIVKYAADEVWEHYWEEDPKETGVYAIHSAHFSYSGKSVGLKSSYATPEEAVSDLNAINSNNPSGGIRRLSSGRLI